MRILRIANVPNNRTGGMSRAMYGTGERLIAMGHEVDYLFQEDLPTSGPIFFQRWTRLLQIPTRIHQLTQAGRHYDVVEIHEPLAAWYCFSRQFSKSLPPVALFSHGLEKRHQLAELAYRRQKGLSVSLTLRYLRLTVLQAMYGLRHCQQAICLNSEDVAYLQQIGVPKHRLTQVHNGIEPEFILAGKAVAEAALPRSGVLFVGSWVLRKGILDLAPAMNLVLQRYPLLHLTIAGCSFDAETVLSEFAEDLHSRIEVIPKLSSNEELIHIYRQHSILVLPSYFEGQPLVMLEAAAMGLAIVTTQICGMADFIENGVNGLTIPVGDVAALYQCLEHLVNDEALARRLGEAARQKAQSYTWTSAAEQLAMAYKQVIQNDLKTCLGEKY